MKLKVENINYKILGLIVSTFCCVGAMNTDVLAQARDPFAKPIVRPKFNPKAPAEKKPGPTAVQAPPIQQRIDGYKSLRMVAAQNGVPAPKPTTVLTIDEMQVTGIFRTPRGYAAMVEATPIKLSYTIYPGEKFYDGQLVAIEESRLIFRRETRMTDGKNIVAAVNKGLVQQSINDMAAARTESTAPTVTAPTATTGTATPVSAEAVPMQENKDAKTANEASTTTTTTASQTINTSPLQPNSIKDSKVSNASAADSSTPVIITEEPSTTAPAKTKAKINRTKKKQ